MFKDKIKDLYERGINLIFPKKCIFCGEYLDYDEEILACGKCRNELPLGEKGCYKTNGDNISYVISPFVYNKAVRKAIHNFKFFDRAHYDKTFAFFMNEAIKAVLEVEKFDVIIPIPLSKKRFRKRGYNQSALLANNLVCGGAMVDENALVRIIDRGPQSKKDPYARGLNVAGCFKCVKDLTGARVLLVDDVCTTGATLNSAAEELILKGAEKVCAVTIAKTEIKAKKRRLLYYVKK